MDDSTRLFELAGAPFVAALLKHLGPDYNALLVTDLGKGAVLLGIDLGASFLAEVGLGAGGGVWVLRRAGCPHRHPWVGGSSLCNALAVVLASCQTGEHSPTTVCASAAATASAQQWCRP